MYRIDFTKEEIKEMSHLACLRFNNIVHKQYKPKDDQILVYGLSHKLIGIMGERAFSKLFNVPLTEELDDSGRADFGSRIDIKVSTEKQSRLGIVNFLLKPERIYILFSLTGYSVTLVGGISGIKFNKIKKPCTKRSAFSFVDVGDLSSAEELMTTRREEIRKMCASN